MPTELKHTVTPAGQGGDYNTLAAAIAHIVAAHANLVTADIYATIEIGGTWSAADTTQVNITGITTDATHYLDIYTTPAARFDPHGGWDAGAYILTNAYGTLTFVNGYFYFDGLQITQGTPTANGRSAVAFSGTFTAGANDIRFSNCLIKGHNHATYTQAVVNAYVAGINLSMWNSAVYNCRPITNNSCVLFTGTGSVLSLRSSLFIGGDYAVVRLSSGTATAKNCYAGGSNTGDWSGVTLTNCGSEDTTGSTSPDLRGIALGTDTFVNVTAGSENFHLAADGLSPLQGTGVDTSGDAAPLNFTTDIDGDTRDATWDIGIDAAAAAGGTPTNVCNCIM